MNSANRSAVGLSLNDEQNALRKAVRELCSEYPDSYWRELDAKNEYPQKFVAALTAAGYLAALIPEEYGGAGLGITEAAIILEEINRAGGNSGACHAQMYVMGTILRHGSDAQKQRYLPEIAQGRLRLQSFAVTEPTAGSDTASIQTRAQRRADRYIINGQKVWTSRVQHTDLLLLLARTSPAGASSGDKTFGLSTILVDLRTAGPGTVDVRPIQTMMNHETNELFFHDLEVPAENLIGEEGKGFRYILDGMNAERILIAAECIGDGRFFVDRAAKYSSDRVVFGNPIGKYQGVQFPIARAYAAVEAASLMRFQAAALFDAGEKCGAEANLAKLLASEASWEAANACMDAHGGYGFARDYGIERKFRETRLYITAPVANNLILAYIGQHVLGMPRSY